MKILEKTNPVYMRWLSLRTATADRMPLGGGPVSDFS